MGTAHSTRSLAEVLFKRSEFAAAALLYEQAKSLYTRLGDGYDAAGTAWSISDCAEQMGDLAGAVAAMKEALRLYEEIPIEESVREAAERLAELETSAGAGAQ
jgi:tetratricopeptide (TPR) repeat protein